MKRVQRRRPLDEKRHREIHHDHQKPHDHILVPNRQVHNTLLSPSQEERLGPAGRETHRIRCVIET